MWDSFLAQFCKVGFVCYRWEPNWLGCIIIAIGALIGAYVVFVAFVLLTGPL